MARITSTMTVVNYEITCGFESAGRRAARVMCEYPDIFTAEDTTVVGHGDRLARIAVTYESFEDAVRLDVKVRESLSRKESPEDVYHINYLPRDYYPKWEPIWGGHQRFSSFQANTTS